MVKNPFLKKILTTVSIASVVVGGGNVALGNALINRSTIGVDAILSTGAELDKSAAPANVAFATGSLFTVGNADVTADVPDVNILALEVAAGGGGIIFHNSATVGSVGGKNIDFKVIDKQTLTLSGVGVTAADALAAKNAADAVAKFNGGNELAINQYNNLADVELGLGSILKFDLQANANGAKAVDISANSVIGGVVAGDGIVILSKSNEVTFGKVGDGNAIQAFVLEDNAKATLTKDIKFDNANPQPVNGHNEVGVVLGTGAELVVSNGAKVLANGANTLANGGVVPDVSGFKSGQGVLTFNASTGANGFQLAVGAVNPIEKIQVTNAANATVVEFEGNAFDGAIDKTYLTVIKDNVKQGGLIRADTIELTANGALDSTIKFTGVNHLVDVSTGKGITTNINEKGKIVLGDAANSKVNFIKGNIGANGKALESITITAGTSGAFQDSEIYSKELGIINSKVLLVEANINASTINSDNASEIRAIGNSSIIGVDDIGTNAAPIAVLKVYAGSSFTTDASNINATNISFGSKVAGGADGTLILTSKNNVNITTDVLIKNGKGDINADALAKGKTLTITGNIGKFAVGKDLATELNLLSAKGGANITLSANAANGAVNINELDITGQDSKITLAKGGKYRIANLINDDKKGTVVIDGNIELMDGTKLGNVNQLKALNFAADNILTFTNNVTINAANITNNANNGQLVVAGNNNILAAKGKNNLNTLILNDNSDLSIKKDIAFNGATTLGADSTLEIGGNFTSESIVGNAANNGTLKVNFVGNPNATIKITTMAANAANAIEKVEMVSGSAEVVGNGLAFTNITFTDPDNSSNLTVPNLNGVDVDVTGVGAGVRTATITGDSTIAAANYIGSKDNPLSAINIKGDNPLTVQTEDFHTSVMTSKDEQGTVTFDVPNGAIVNDLGSIDKDLKVVNFNTNTSEVGNLYALTTNIANDATVSFSEVVSTNMQVGGQAILKDGSVVSSNTKFTPTSNDAILTFNSNIPFMLGGINGGNNDMFFKSVSSTGKGDVLLSGNVSAQNINLGNSNIDLQGADRVLSGTTTLNGNINLGNNNLTFQDNRNGNSQWGPNTSITTTFANGHLGTITANDTIQVNGNVDTTALHINDQGLLGNTGPLLLVKGGKNVTFANGNDFILGKITSTQRYSGYDITHNDVKDVYVSRIDNAANILPDDVTVAGGDSTDLENVGRLLASVTDGSSLSAKEFATDLGLFASPEEAGTAFRKATTPPQGIHTVLEEQLVEHSDQVMLGRAETTLDTIRGREDGGNISTPPAAGGCIKGAEVGAWFAPFYGQATQKKRHHTVGYKAKSGGGIVGFDTVANDNLVIGGAVTFVKTDLKYKNIKAGDKSTLNSYIFSLYGAQQLVRDFFVQGVVSLGTSKIKTKEHRMVPTATGSVGTQIAHSKYNTMFYGGEVRFGYNAKVYDSVFLTPMAGIRYAKFSDDSYRQTGTTHQNFVVSKKSTDKIEGVIGARVESATNVNGVAVIPEAHAFVSYHFGGKSPRIDMRLEGMTTPFVTRSDKPAKTFYNVGFGANAKVGNMEYGIGYDAHLAKKYVGHQGTLKVRVTF